jgi:hypothetical protein
MAKVITYLIVFFIQCTVIYICWDNVFTNIFGIRDITYAEAMGIGILASTLFNQSEIRVSNLKELNNK